VLLCRGDQTKEKKHRANNALYTVEQMPLLPCENVSLVKSI